MSIHNGANLTTGSLAVGSSGTLTIDPSTVNVLGNFSLSPGGILSLGVGGADSNLISQLNISGFGLFDGTVDLDFIDGFAPATGERFELITSSGGADFSRVTFDIQGLQPGFQYRDVFSNDQFVLTALNNGVSNTSTPEPSTFRLFMLVALAVCLGSAVPRVAKSRRSI